MNAVAHTPAFESNAGWSAERTAAARPDEQLVERPEQARIPTREYNQTRDPASLASPRPPGRASAHRGQRCARAPVLEEISGSAAAARRDYAALARAAVMRDSAAGRGSRSAKC
jgi:hypothetical protein